MNLNGVEYYYVKNGQGDIVGLLDESGTEMVSYVYDSWGKLVSTSGTLKDTLGAKNPYRYRGYRYDIETGYYYLNSRYYNPNWGRFLNADGITGITGELLSHNIFAYCANNPINMEDPSGYFGLRSLTNKINNTLLFLFTYISSRAYVNQQRINSKVVEYGGKAIDKMKGLIGKVSKGSGKANLKFTTDVSRKLELRLRVVELGLFREPQMMLGNSLRIR